MLEVSIQTDRLLDELHQLAATPNTESVEARAALQSLCEAAGLTIRVDALGNTFARWCPPSVDAALPAVGTGSHGPTNPDAGLDDGPLGVMAGLEALRALQRAGVQPKRPVELVMFAGELDARCGINHVGSRAVAGLLTPEVLTPLTQEQNTHGDPADLPLAPDHFHAWVQLHPEQGPKLEKQNAPIGIVMGLAAAATYVFEVTGEDGHAANVLMPDRRDALCAAAETIHAIEQFARSSPSPDLVATVGQLDVFPGTAHAIPSKVRFTLDLRDTDSQNRDQIAAAIQEECNTIGLRRGIKITRETRHADAPAACDKHVIDAIEKACDDADVRWWKLISPRDHDALFIAPLAPTGMILIPSRPDADSTPAQISAGVEVLALTLANLATS